MIESIRFQNFKAVRDATLSLGPFNLIVGPNGSGKSTVMQALSFAGNAGDPHYRFDKLLSIGLDQQS